MVREFDYNSYSYMTSRRLLLTQRLALGDAVLMTGLVRDIAATYPDVEIYVDTHCGEVWDNNPHVKRKVEGLDYWKQITVHYGEGIKAAKAGLKVHMLAWFYRDFVSKFGSPLAPRLPHGDLILTDAEKARRSDAPYWVCFAGGKTDVPVKIYPQPQWQAVVDGLAKYGIRLAQLGATGSSFINPRLDGVVDMVGKTPTHRDVFSLIYNAQGVISPISAGMHIAACFNKPCVVIAGGREDVWWEGYMNNYGAFGPGCAPVQVEHQYLHTIGKLFCCSRGCWKHRVVAGAYTDRWSQPNQRCQMPVSVDNKGTYVPRCMTMISPEDVINAVLSYKNIPYSITESATDIKPSVTLSPSSAPMSVCH